MNVYVEVKTSHTKWFVNVRTTILHFHHNHETYLNLSHSVADYPRVSLSPDNLLFS